MARRISIVRRARRAPFPRPGEPIFPRALRGLLVDRHANPDAAAVDLHAVGDLGASAWTRLPAQICRRAGTAVVDRVQTRLTGLPDGLLDAPLPGPSTVLAFALERRTANTLRRALTDGEEGAWTLRRYLSLPRFGGRAVVDLLAAVEAHGLVSRSDVGHDVSARIALVVANLPISERRARLLTEREGIPGEAVNLNELARAAVRDGGRVPFRIVELGGVKIAVGLSQVTAARIAYRLATRAVRGAGGARIRAIAAQLRQTPDLAVDIPFVERVLSEVNAFRWIDRREGWFLFAGQPNPLLKELKKVLAVRSVLSLQALRALFRRTIDTWFSAEALSAICAELGGVRVEGNLVRLAV